MFRSVAQSRKLSPSTPPLAFCAILRRMKYPSFVAHPWHGISSGENAPQVVNAFIEIVPSDTVKYEVDKASGHLRLDRPQKFSNLCPALYGFIPQTYCGARIGARCAEKAQKVAVQGDGDPLDICVLTERVITMGNLLVCARPIGGLRMIDGDQADDKILSVLVDDPMYGAWQDLADCPKPALDRLMHYFLTYKDMPGQSHRRVEIAHIYDASEARVVIDCACEDYRSLLND